MTASKLQERFSWKALDFAFPDERTRQVALQTGGFIPENNLPVGIELWGDKLFVTVPRWRAGRPPATPARRARRQPGGPSSACTAAAYLP